MMRKLSVFLYLCALAVSVHAQEQLLSDETKTESFLLRYQNSDDRSQQVVNYLLKELSRHSNRNRQSDQIVFTYEQTTRVSRKAKQVNSFVIIKSFRSDSRVNYRGFPMEDVLIPAKLEMDCQLITKNNKLIASYKVDDADFSAGKNEFSFSYIDTNNLKDLLLVVKSKQFRYTQQNKTVFNNRLADIDRYYDVVARMSMAFDDLARINPNNIELLYDYDRTIKSIYSFLDELDHDQLAQTLNLREFDPQMYLRKKEDLRYETDRQRDIVNYTISILYQIFYNRGLELLVNGNEAGAVSYFEKSLYNNPTFAPALLQLARIDFNNNRVDDAAIKVRDIFREMNPDPEIFQLTSELAGKIYLSYLQTGENQMDQGAYQVALESFYKTRNFCSSVPGNLCSDQLSININKAIQGIYNSYVDNGRFYLNKGDLLTAEKEARRALDYYNANKKSIANNSEAINLLTEIKNQEYLRLIAQGKIQLKSKNFKGAFSTLQNAETLEGQYNINKSAELRNLLQLAAKPVILSNLDDGLEMVKQNKIAEAKDIVISSNNLQNKYSLNGDREITRTLEDLRKKIFTQECINAQNEYDLHVGKARGNILNKSYLLADQDLNNAYAVADRNLNCMIDKTEALKIQHEVKPAVVFQNMQKTIEADVNQNRFTYAILSYRTMEQFYIEQQIKNNYGLDMQPLIPYISQQSNTFIIFAINQFINEKKYEDAMELMNVLKNKSTPSKEVKNEQKTLGTQLAIRDHAKDPAQNPKVKVLEYTQAHKWYSNLSKAYVKQWKKMK